MPFLPTYIPPDVCGPVGKDPATTPVAYTRGLQSADGLWDNSSGVYKDSGGFVAYLGGNVVFQSTAEGLFTSSTTGPSLPKAISHPRLRAKGSDL